MDYSPTGHDNTDTHSYTYPRTQTDVTDVTNAGTYQQLTVLANTLFNALTKYLQTIDDRLTP